MWSRSGGPCARVPALWKHPGLDGGLGNGEVPARFGRGGTSGRRCYSAEAEPSVGVQCSSFGCCCYSDRQKHRWINCPIAVYVQSFIFVYSAVSVHTARNDAIDNESEFVMK